MSTRGNTLRSTEKSGKTTKKDTKGDAPFEGLHEDDGVLEQAQVQQEFSPERLVTEITRSITAAMDEKFDSFLSQLQDIANKIQDNTKRLDEVETRVSGAEDELVSTKTKLERALHCLEDLTVKVDDLENRSRRENLIILNFPEGAEGANPVKFFQSWLPTFLGLGDEQTHLDRAHRLGRSPSQLPERSGRRPRPVILKLHYFQDKGKILNAAKSSGPRLFQGSEIFFVQDFSQSVRQRRRGFNEVCEQLKKLNIRFGMSFPATLRIVYNGSTIVCDTPGKAVDFIGKLGDPS